MTNAYSLPQQYKDLSASGIAEQLAVCAKNLLDAKVSQNVVRKSASVLAQRRQIARLLTHLQNITT